MNFDLPKVEVRAMERRIVCDVNDKFDAGFRAIAELLAERGKSS